MTKDKGQISEVLIIGGGIIGLSIARELHKSGVKKITILEKNSETGREASFAAAGMLAPHAETDRLDDFYRFCEISNRLYPNFVEELFEETGVDVELDKSGTLYLAFTESDVSEIRRRFDWQKKTGLKVEHLSPAEIHKLEPFVSPDVLEGLFFSNDWQVENRKLLVALRKYAEINDIEIVENAPVKSLRFNNGKMIGASTEKEFFPAEQTVLATGAWTSHIKAAGYEMPVIKPVRGQMISFRTAKRLFSKVIYTKRGYLVPRQDGRILIGATVEDAGFDKKSTADGTAFLRETALEIAPSLVNLEIAEKWSGLRPVSADGLPILGAFPGTTNLFIAAAHYRNGILLAPATAQILAGKIVNYADSKYLEIFGLKRFGKNEIFASA